MRALLLASASIILMGGTALAQNSSGSPMSTKAAHTSSANTRGAIAPRLPIPAQDASINEFLTHAETALKRGRTGEAQEALERAETRALSRSTDAGTQGTPYNGAQVAAIQEARHAVGRGDRKAAMAAINTAMAAPSTAASDTMPMKTPMGSTSTPPGTPFTSVPADPNVRPNSLGGISSSVGGAGGSGGNQRRPQASFSGGTADVPPNSLGGISNSTAGDGGTGAGSSQSARPQADFSGPATQPNGTPTPVPAQ